MIFLFCSFVGIIVSLACIYENNKWGKYDSISYIAQIVSFSPLIAIIMFVGFPPALRDLNNLLLFISPRQKKKKKIIIIKNVKKKIFFRSIPIFLGVYLGVCWLLNSVIMGKVFPLQFVYVNMFTISILYSLKDEYKRGEKCIVNWLDVLILLSLFAPLNM